MVGSAHMVGGGNSAVLGISPSEHYTSTFPLPTDGCFTSHDYSTVLSGWVINACYVLDIFCGFTALSAKQSTKLLLYASKLCTFCFQRLFLPSPRCPKEGPREGGGESGCRTARRGWEQCRERACRGGWERKFPTLGGSKPWDCKPDLYPL